MSRDGRTEKCSEMSDHCIFATSAVHGGRMPRAQGCAMVRHFGAAKSKTSTVFANISVYPQIRQNHSAMKLIETLFGKSKSTTGKKKDNRRRAIGLLHRLQAEHCFLEVRSSHRNDELQSMILEVRESKGQLVIDEPFNPDHREMLAIGENLEIRCNHPMLSISFISKIIDIDDSHHPARYIVAIPEKFQTSQSRAAYRVFVSPRDNISVDLFAKGGKALPAEVVNLSSQGIQLSIPGNRIDRIGEIKSSLRVLIHTFDAEPLRATFEVRHIELKSLPTSHTLVGGRLLHINPTGQNRLNQLLAALQRAQRRRLSGVA